MNQFVFGVVSMSSETKQWMKNRWVMLTHLFDKKHPDCNGIIAAWSQCRDHMKEMMQKHPNATFSLWDMTQGRCGKNNSDALRFMHHQIRQNEIADVMGKNNEFGEGGKAKTICAFELQWPTLAFDVQWPDDTLDTRDHRNQTRDRRRDKNEPVRGREHIELAMAIAAPDAATSRSSPRDTHRY